MPAPGPSAFGADALACSSSGDAAAPEASDVRVEEGSCELTPSAVIPVIPVMAPVALASVVLASDCCWRHQSLGAPSFEGQGGALHATLPTSTKSDANLHIRHTPDTHET